MSSVNRCTMPDRLPNRRRCDRTHGNFIDLGRLPFSCTVTGCDFLCALFYGSFQSKRTLLSNRRAYGDFTMPLNYRQLERAACEMGGTSTYPKNWPPIS